MSLDEFLDHLADDQLAPIDVSTRIESILALGFTALVNLQSQKPLSPSDFLIWEKPPPDPNKEAKRFRLLVEAHNKALEMTK